MRVHMLARKPLVHNARILRQASSLRRAGYRVTIAGKASPQALSVELVDGVTLKRFGARPGLGATRVTRLLGFYIAAYRGLRREIEDGQIIHCNDMDTLALGLMLARGRNARLVYDVQDLYPDQDHIPRWASPVLRVLERWLIRRVDRTIAVNDEIGAVTLERFGIEVDSVVLNCPPYVAMNGAQPGSVREVLGIAPDRRIMIYSGVLAPNRGLEQTVLALRELHDVSLVFLGDGPLRAHLRSLAETSGLADRVFFCDFVPHLEVPRFISSADIGIVPYERRGLNHYLCSPNKLFHYIMAELPVVCSDFLFLRQIVLGHGIGEVFDPDDPSSIAGAVRNVLNDQLADESAKERLRAVKRRYCWEQEEPRFLATYRSLKA